ADHWQAARTLYLALRDQLKIEPMSDFRKLSCQHHLGLIAEQLGNLEESLTIYQSCLDPMAKSFGAADLTKPGVQARMAVVEFKQGHADQARQYFQAAKAALDSAVPINHTALESASKSEDTRQASQLNEQALNLISQKQYEKAIALLEKSHEDNPEA